MRMRRRRRRKRKRRMRRRTNLNNSMMKFKSVVQIVRRSTVEGLVNVCITTSCAQHTELVFTRVCAICTSSIAA